LATLAQTEQGPRRRPGRPTLSNEELLDTALDLFLESGFERTSIDAIASAAGMAKRTIYARYEDKTSLFKAALQRAIEVWIVPVERLDEAETGDLEETLLAVGGILVANLLSPAGLRLLRLTNAESGRMPEIGAYNVEQGTKPTIDWLAALFRRRLGERIDPAEATAAGEGFLHLVVGGPAIDSAWGVRRDDAAVERHTRFAVRLFLHGLLDGRGEDAGLEAENRRLRALLSEAAAIIAKA
jgi:AcrR family transcriptional regulator